MSGLSESTVSAPAPDKAQTAFKAWLRRFVTGDAELQAFDAGEIDAVMDRDSGKALLLPEAQSALHETNCVVLGTLDVLPGEICVVDADGAVVLINKAWRLSGAGHGRAGLDVRSGENFFRACRDAPDGERAQADAVAAGLRDVLAGTRPSARFRYACPSAQGTHAFTLAIVATSARVPLNALLTREWHERELPAPPKATRRKPERAAAAKLNQAGNALLSALTAKGRAQLADGLEVTTVRRGEVLHEAGESMRDVYFPIDCIVSLLTLIEGRRALEVGMVGREGMVGARLALGGIQSSVRALVQTRGTVLKMKAERFLHEFRRSRNLQRVLLQFTGKLMDQISQTAACNRFHVVAERLARCLLMTAERTRANTFHLTHGFIADMLGVRREGVTVAAIELQQRGLIRYRRGDISILDLDGLNAVCCSCHRHLQVMDS